VSAWQVGVVFGAAFVAGVVNAIAGGGTLISFPTLLWLGRNPVLANATNTVGIWPASFLAMVGFRKEVGRSRAWIVLLVGPALLGGILGAVLLLHTPTSTFKAIVPWLIFGATVLLGVQEPLSRRLGRGEVERPSGRWRLFALAFQFVVGVYGGYFGAGIGILMLAALGLLGLRDLHQMNGVKNLLALCINGIAAIWFVATGSVLWRDVLLLAVGSGLGGWVGAGLALRVGRRTVRVIVIAVGLAMTVALAVRLR
jgi:uncharacterized protein